MGVILALGEMDVDKVNLYRYDQGTPSAHGLVRILTVSGGRSIPEQIPGQSLTRWTTTIRPVSHRAYGDGR